MADTLQNITIVENTWTDLYGESGLTVGTQLIVENVGLSEIRLYSGATNPLDNGQSTGFSILQTYKEKTNQGGDLGAWAWSSNTGLVNVRGI